MNWIYMKGISIDAEYVYRRALEHLEQERYETALRYFRQAVVIAPRYARAFYAMAYCHANLGKYDDAIRLYNRAIEIEPTYLEARIQRDMIANIRDLTRVNPPRVPGTPSGIFS